MLVQPKRGVPEQQSILRISSRQNLRSGGCRRRGVVESLPHTATRQAAEDGHAGGRYHGHHAWVGGSTGIVR